MRKLQSLLILVLLVVCLGLARAVGNPGVCNSQLRHDQTLKVNDELIHVQKALSEDERATGLANRNCLNDDEGMLFVFSEPGFYSFWMKDTQIPLDIVWLSANQKVVDLETSVQPSTYPKTFINDKPAMYVLELAAGRAAQLGLKSGTQLFFQ